jgi:hypothetical protein
VDFEREKKSLLLVREALFASSILPRPVAEATLFFPESE